MDKAKMRQIKAELGCDGYMIMFKTGVKRTQDQGDISYQTQKSNATMEEVINHINSLTNPVIYYLQLKKSYTTCEERIYSGLVFRKRRSKESIKRDKDALLKSIRLMEMLFPYTLSKHGLIYES
jgi:hypothetical protein